MDELSYTSVIREQTRRALWNVRNVISCVPGGMWGRDYCEMPLWKHIYHTLHSLDRYFINPWDYTEPPFHVQDLNDLDVKTDKALSRDDLIRYLECIEQKINAYLDGLTDGMLLEKPESSAFTRFTLILAQHRHLNCHLGMLMGFIIAETGLWPVTVGLQSEIPAEYGAFC